MTSQQVTPTFTTHQSCILPSTPSISVVFFFNDTATPEIYPLPLHAPLPIPCANNGEASRRASLQQNGQRQRREPLERSEYRFRKVPHLARKPTGETARSSSSNASNLIDRKSTRLNSSHSQISYAVFCLKKKK